MNTKVPNELLAGYPFPGGGGSGVTDVETRAELSALNGDVETAFLYGEDGRAGLFVEKTGDQSALVTADPEEGRTVPFSSDLSGASGVYARAKQYDGIPTWEFGLRPDESGVAAANVTAWQAAQDYARDHNGGKVLLPDGDVEINASIEVHSSATIVQGMGHAGSFNNNDGNALRGTLINYTGSGDAAVINIGNGVNLYTGVELRDMTIDANDAAGVNGYRLNNGIIDARFSGVHALNTKKGCLVLGTGATTSFGNLWFDCTFEHFSEMGLDIWGDGNESIVFGCKFINTSGNTPSHSMRVGNAEIANGIWIQNCSFGSTNVDHHIEIVESTASVISGNTIEASGNSSVTASSLLALGSGAKKCKGTLVQGNRFLGNGKADNAVRFENVEDLTMIANVYEGVYTNASRVSNANASGVISIANRNLSASGVIYSSLTGIDVNLDGDPIEDYTLANANVLRSGNRNTITVETLYDLFATHVAEVGGKI